MADNVIVAPAASGTTIAADDIGGILHQRVKVVLGNDGVTNGDVSTSNPMPVSIVSGVELEFKNDAGNPLPVTGSVNVTNTTMPTTPVTGTFWQATQPVSGPLTDTQLRASAVPVSISSSPLPSGAATETTLSALNTKVTTTVNGLKVDGSAVTQPVSASSLPLPTGASTSALQTTGNSSLSSIDGKTPSLGQALSAASVPVVLPAAQITTLTPPTSVGVNNFPSTQAISATTLPLPNGAATETTLSALNTKTPALGQALATGSVPVVLTAAQITTLTPPTSVGVNNFPSTQAVSAASLPLPSGASTSALQTSGNASLTSIDSKIPSLVAGDFPIVGTDSVGIFNSSRVLTVQSAGVGSPSQPISGSVSVSNFPATQDVSLASIPLATDAATATNQASEIALLNTIATNTGATSTDTLANGTISALNGTVSINAQGGYTISALISGTFVATYIAEGLMANGTTWITLPMYIIGLNIPYPSTFSGSAPANVLITGGGYTAIRIRASAYTSGTLNVALNASLGQQTVASAQLGTWNVNAAAVNSATYCASFNGAITALAATDVFTISGSATKTVYVWKMAISGIQTTASAALINFIKRSTANSGGTSTTVSAISHDSIDPAGTAVVRAYTINPTLGTQVGTNPFFSLRKEIPTAAFANSDYAPFVMDLQSLVAKPVVLRGVAESLCVNLAGASLSGNNMSFKVEWTEA